MKNKQIFIIIGIVLVIILGVLALNLINKNDTDLKAILNNSSEIEAVIDNNKKIELVSLKESENIDKVKIWVFSEPIYLGEFNLIKEESKYYLEGLEDILKTKNLEIGSHRLLIMNGDKALGYVKIEISADNSLKSTSEEDNKEENVNETETTNNITSTTTTTKVRETKTTTKTQEEVKCTPKKFKNKYTYVYDDETTCVKNGDQIDAWNYFRANDIPATTYGCEKIVDECRNTYYGVYYGNTEGKKFYY